MSRSSSLRSFFSGFTHSSDVLADVSADLLFSSRFIVALMSRSETDLVLSVGSLGGVRATVVVVDWSWVCGWGLRFGATGSSMGSTLISGTGIAGADGVLEERQM